MTSLPSTMQAIDIAPDGMLVIARHPVPTLAGGEVLVRVAYAGVNRADLLQREGRYAPPEGASPIPGLEISGHIVATGEGVAGWNPDQPVCALLSGGGYAEYVAVPTGQLLPIPANISLRDAATLPEAAATAMMALAEEGGLRPGARVLVHGGASGVGLMLIQIAQALGASEVYATAGGPEKCALVSALGAIAVDHRRAPFYEQLAHAPGDASFDLIIDILGGPQLAHHLKLLRTGGRLVMLAMLEGNTASSIKLSGLLMRGLSIRGCTLRSKGLAQKAALVAQVRAVVWPDLERGTIRPVVDSVLPLEAAEKAHARMQERLHCGKILLEVAAK